MKEVFQVMLNAFFARLDTTAAFLDHSLHPIPLLVKPYTTHLTTSSPLPAQQVTIALLVCTMTEVPLTSLTQLLILMQNLLLMQDKSALLETTALKVLPTHSNALLVPTVEPDLLQTAMNALQDLIAWNLVLQCQNLVLQTTCVPQELFHQDNVLQVTLAQLLQEPTSVLTVPSA
jgi:hypothetical protein